MSFGEDGKMAVEFSDREFDLFIGSMVREMNANRNKGDKWVDCPPDFLVLQIYEHTGKLHAAIRAKDAAKIKEYTADVANLAFMTLQACQGGVPREWDDSGSGGCSG